MPDPSKFLKLKEVVTDKNRILYELDVNTRKLRTGYYRCCTRCGIIDFIFYHIAVYVSSINQYDRIIWSSRYPDYYFCSKVCKELWVLNNV